MALPHIQNSQAGINRWDPVHSCLFEVYFTLPDAIKQQFGSDEALITEHVVKIGGLDALDKQPDTSVTQKFMGTTRTYLAPKMDSTSAEDISVTLSLNLRNGTDNYIYKIFKSWQALNYDKSTGSIQLKTNYCADWLRIAIANREGEIIRSIVFKDVMMKSMDQSATELDYSTTDAVELTVHFASDWWTEELA